MSHRVPYRVSQNEIFGRYLVASKNIRQGELILKESPAVVGPQIDGSICCFNCFSSLMNGFIFCPKCESAVICSPKCTGKFHTEEECISLKNFNISGDIISNNDQIIFPLRCLLLKKYNEDIFKQIFQMQHHLESRKNTPIYRRHKIQVEKILNNFLNPKEIEDELIQKICGILDVNTFEIRPPNNSLTITNPAKQCLRGLYLQAALMAHNCRANTHISVDNNFVMTIYASVDIKEGAPIFFNYASGLQGTLDRKLHLKEGKYFDCTCERCEDPTEFQTNISSIKCYKCKLGIIRPLKNINLGWECSECKKIYHHKLVQMIVNEGRRLIDFLDPNFDPKNAENLLKKLQKTFHENHFLILELIQTLIGIYCQINRNKQNLSRKIELCEHLLRVYDKLEPGISRIKAITMYELQSSMVDLCHKKYQDKEITTEKLLKELESAQNILKESVKFLLYEPTNSPEGNILKVAMSELKMLQISLDNIKNDLNMGNIREKSKESVKGKDNNNNCKRKKNKKRH